MTIYNVAASQLSWTTAQTGGDNNDNLPQKLPISPVTARHLLSSH